MKVILNKDLSPLGEEGDVKDVAKGYARNFLFPRGIALPYNDNTLKLFEGRRTEIEERKAQKRNDAAGLRERLENLNLEITMPAGANGKLYGAVTSQTVMEELSKQGFQIERKRIELAGSSIKNVGKYKVSVKLYENASAEITVNVLGQEIKTETKTAAASRPNRRRRESREEQAAAGSAAPAHEGAVASAADVPSGETKAEEAPSAENAGEAPSGV